MNTDISVSQAPIAAPAAWLRPVGVAVAASAFVAACAHVALPLGFTPVPLTFGPFAVLLVGLLLSPRLAAASLAAYLAEGALGLPVFAPGPLGASGFAHLLGPTAGYLLAYPAAAALVSALWRRAGRSFPAALAAASAGSFAILFCGALWLAVLSHSSVSAALGLGLLPFLPGDALKVVAAAALAHRFQRLRRHSS